MNDMTPKSFTRVGSLPTPEPEPPTLRQREVIALESIAKTLEELLIQLKSTVWYANNVRQ